MTAKSARKLRVTYLIGAGATHACAKAVSSPYGVLTDDLNDVLAARVRKLVVKKYSGFPGMADLANSIVDRACDVEHVITFLDESVSATHRRLANDLRGVFHSVLKRRLKDIHTNHGSQPNGLYAALLDLHEVSGIGEILRGLLTLNYDDYLETVVTKIHGKGLDLGLDVKGRKAGAPISLMKLHGSFGWKDAWPVTLSNGATPLWIPPGIQKAKGRYPFNLIWGRAREMLDCDVLRIVGCRLSPNDWDLISLLFSTCLVHSGGKAYDIEIIDAPEHALTLKSSYPYLRIKSLLEVDRIGEALIGELLSSEPRPFGSLSDTERAEVVKKAGTGRNWFQLWLKQRAEILYSTLGSLATPTGHANALLGVP